MTLLFATEHDYTTTEDISSVAFWQQSPEVRDRTFARLRRDAPVSWHRPLEIAGLPDSGEAGFWALTLAEDIRRVSMDSKTFSSHLGGVALEPTPVEAGQMLGFFLCMDPPQQTAFRKLISAAFTPKRIAKLTDQIHDRARRIVDDLDGAGKVDFVERCSAILPMQTVCDMIGVPESEQEGVRHAADMVVSTGDEGLLQGKTPIEFKMEQYFHLHSVGASIAAHRRDHPAEDLVTNLVQAEVDGHKLTDEQIGSFMVLMSVAGNDTTKHTTSHTMRSLYRHPEQRDWLLEDFDGRIMRSIEEFVRHASPVIQFTRTATVDTEIRGQQVAAGDKVALFYASGNRDETLFEDPWAFDLRRESKPHVGFGGGGAHYCLGNGVAKVQLKALFGQLLTRLPHIEVGEPDYLPGNFVNAVRHLPVHV